MDSAAQQWIARAAGLGGVILVALSLAGITATLNAGGVSDAPASKVSAEPRPQPVAASPVSPPAVPVAAAKVAAPQAVAVSPVYPLDVGRYWVYRYREPDSDVVMEIERTIVRRQPRPAGTDLFIFDDGGVVYIENGKVFEMSSNGGVNIIPVDTGSLDRPILYTSQGMQIEKWLGAIDTSVVVDDRRFEGCLEVVTRFRAVEAGDGGSNSVSYSSFYAPGIGMVGRQTWPRDERGSLAITLADHGTRKL